LTGHQTLRRFKNRNRNRPKMRKKNAPDVTKFLLIELMRKRENACNTLEKLSILVLKYLTTHPQKSFEPENTRRRVRSKTTKRMRMKDTSMPVVRKTSTSKAVKVSITWRSISSNP
jgi:hypothetical protein